MIIMIIPPHMNFSYLTYFTIMYAMSSNLHKNLSRFILP
jgi:hypothetical protein